MSSSFVDRYGAGSGRAEKESDGSKDDLKLDSMFGFMVQVIEIYRFVVLIIYCKFVNRIISLRP